MAFLRFCVKRATSFRATRLPQLSLDGFLLFNSHQSTQRHTRRSAIIVMSLPLRSGFAALRSSASPSAFAAPSIERRSNARAPRLDIVRYATAHSRRRWTATSVSGRLRQPESRFIRRPRGPLRPSSAPPYSVCATDSSKGRESDARLATVC